MTYPGGKNGSGVYQAIINQIPPHERFVECFFGSGTISRLKRPATLASIGIESDAAVIAQFPSADYPYVELIQARAETWLCENRQCFTPQDLIYLDPPYLMDTRRSKGRIYHHEFSTEQEHGELLENLLTLDCMVAISGYYHDLYADLLKHWRCITFTGVTRGGGVATEYLWMNYREPLELHDYRYLGENFRKRQDINRQKTRWVQRLARMQPVQRHALMAAIDEFKAGAISQR